MVSITSEGVVSISSEGVVSILVSVPSEGVVSMTSDSGMTMGNSILQPQAGKRLPFPFTRPHHPNQREVPK